MNDERKAELERLWKKIATLAVTDENFKNRLVSDPIAVMSEQGLNLPPGAQARMDTEKEVNIILAPEVTQELAQESQWWKRRLDMIREFGKADEAEKPFMSIPEGQDDV